MTKNNEDLIREINGFQERDEADERGPNVLFSMVRSPMTVMKKR